MINVHLKLCRIFSHLSSIQRCCGGRTHAIDRVYVWVFERLSVSIDLIKLRWHVFLISIELSNKHNPSMNIHTDATANTFSVCHMNHREREVQSPVNWTWIILSIDGNNHRCNYFQSLSILQTNVKSRAIFLRWLIQYPLSLRSALFSSTLRIHCIQYSFHCRWCKPQFVHICMGNGGKRETHKSLYLTSAFTKSE